MKPPAHPPGYTPEKYAMKYRCTNCGRESVQYIDKGKPAPKKYKEPCVNCGCKKLVRQ